MTGSALACSSIDLDAAHFGRRQDGYDQSDLPDVIILLKVIVSLFCIKIITKYITENTSNCKVCVY